MTLNQDFKELLQSFATFEVRYVVVGGYAVVAHGVVRTTKDIDLFVEPSEDNAGRVIKALDAFGMRGAIMEPEKLAEPNKIAFLGVPPRRIDIITGIEGVAFEEAWSSRIVVDVDGVPVSFIGRGALIKNKKAVGRPQDLADVAKLEMV